MQIGTRSLLFGVHQFLWHPITVYVAWCRLYGQRPTWRETVCIVVHDWGYWGCENMDGSQGGRHPELGAAIAGRLFGPKWYDFVLLHSRYLSERLGREPSKLCWADKCSMIYDWQPFYLLRARLTGELAEYRANADRRGFIPLAAPDRCWHDKLVRRLVALAHKEREKFIERSSYT